MPDVASVNAPEPSPARMRTRLRCASSPNAIALRSMTRSSTSSPVTSPFSTRVARQLSATPAPVFGDGMIDVVSSVNAPISTLSVSDCSYSSSTRSVDVPAACAGATNVMVVSFTNSAPTSAPSRVRTLPAPKSTPVTVTVSPPMPCSRAGSTDVIAFEPMSRYVSRCGDSDVWPCSSRTVTVTSPGA